MVVYFLKVSGDRVPRNDSHSCQSEQPSVVEFLSFLCPICAFEIVHELFLELLDRLLVRALWGLARAESEEGRPSEFVFGKDSQHQVIMGIL